MSSAFNIPAGFALVPLEPTHEQMLCGTEWVRNDYLVKSCYRAMLAAAPTPPVDAVPGEPVADHRCRNDVSVCKRKACEVGCQYAHLAASVASRAGSEPADPHAHWIRSADGLSSRNPAPDASAPMIPTRSVELKIGYGTTIAPAEGSEKQRFLELLAAAHRAIDGILDGLRRDTAHMATAKLVQSLTAPAAAAEPSERAASLVADPVTVTVERMVESVNGVSWWVVLRRGKERQDDGKYGADFKNRAEWHAAGLRWILGQGDKPNIRDFMDVEGSAGEAQS